MSKLMNVGHTYEDEGWLVSWCMRSTPTWEVQKIDDLDILESDYQAIPLARERGYVVDEDCIVHNLNEKGELIPSNFNDTNTYLNLGFNIDTDYSLSLDKLEDLVESVIKHKFWSTVDVGTKTTRELIIEFLNK